MMTQREVTQDQVNRLLDDAAYLQDEAEALKYVIEQVPYSDVPPEGKSIYAMLELLDYAQVSYYRPLIERIFSENRIIRLADLEHYETTFISAAESEKGDEPDINKLLNKIIKHRAGIINVLKQLMLIDWEREVKDRDKKSITLFQFVERMVKGERKILKDIADLVLIYQNEKLSTREITARAKQRNKT
jgi:hypothetical protein